MFPGSCIIGLALSDIKQSMNVHGPLWTILKNKNLTLVSIENKDIIVYKHGL